MAEEKQGRRGRRRSYCQTLRNKAECQSFGNWRVLVISIPESPIGSCGRCGNAKDSTVPADISSRSTAAQSLSDIHTLYPIIRAIIESPPHAGLYKGLEELLERHPSDSGWQIAIMATHKHRSKKTESLLARWLQLNVGNPEMWVSSHIVFARSPEILDAGLRLDAWRRTRSREPAKVNCLSSSSCRRIPQANASSCSSICQSLVEGKSKPRGYWAYLCSGSLGRPIKGRHWRGETMARAPPDQ